MEGFKKLFNSLYTLRIWKRMSIDINIDFSISPRSLQKSWEARLTILASPRGVHNFADIYSCSSLNPLVLTNRFPSRHVNGVRKDKILSAPINFTDLPCCSLWVL